MIITLVMDQYGNLNNGTTATAMRFAKILMEKGHEIRVLTCEKYDGSEGEKVYKLNQWIFPVFNPLIESQGMKFASPDDEVIMAAIKDSDIVHILLPFKLGSRVLKLCEEHNIPHMGAFHCQPENITYSAYVGKSKFINNRIYAAFRKFYNRLEHVHCPSNMIANQLKSHGYTCQTEVISNGVIDAFKPIEVERPLEFKDKIVILNVGRFSGEKRQALVIDAVAKSKYQKDIVLIFCGKGPRRKALENRSQKLINGAIFKFCKQDELIKIMNYADFYIHASDAEIEGISCIEAISCGQVPIISDSPLSASSQFSLSEHCIFKHGSSKDLASKIDYLIEHPEEVFALKPRYAEEGKKYEIHACVDQMIELYQKVLAESKK